MGASPAFTQIHAPALQRAFDVAESGQLVLETLTVYGGEADAGGVMRVLGSAVLTDVAMIGGTAGKGGLVYNAGNFGAVNGLFLGGTATEGGAVYSEGRAIIEASIFAGNAAAGGYGGGAVLNNGELRLADSLLAENSSVAFGGGVTSLASMRTESVVVTGNRAPKGGGVAQLDGSWATNESDVVIGNAGAAGDVAVFEHGSAGTILDPETYSLGELDAASHAVELSVATVTDDRFNGPEQLVGINGGVDHEGAGVWRVTDSPSAGHAAVWSTEDEMFLVLPASDGPSHSLPLLDAVAASWEPIGSTQVEYQGASITVGYHGDTQLLVPYELAASAGEQLAWNEFDIHSAESLGGGAVEVVTSTVAGMSRSALAYRPAAGFVGADRIVVTGANGRGDIVEGEIVVDVTAETRLSIVAEAVERADGLVVVELRIPNNGRDSTVRSFGMSVSYSPEVLEPIDGGRVGATFDALREIRMDAGYGPIEPHVHIRGLATGTAGDALATLHFRRLTAGNAGLRISPEYGWELGIGRMPLSPQVVDTVYSEFSMGDVNRDGRVSPLDALNVINALNRGTPVSFELDTNGDNRLTPLDALQVINRLNRQPEDTGGDGRPWRSDGCLILGLRKPGGIRYGDSGTILRIVFSVLYSA